jgi:hypothetical protein
MFRLAQGLGLLGVVLSLSACLPMEGNLEVGELDKAAPHALKPQAQQLYHVVNRRTPGGNVFLFHDAAALTACFKAMRDGGDAKTMCTQGVSAHVEDKTVVRTLDCDQAQAALCQVQVIEGENAGLRGAILWDWLEQRD